MHLTAFADYSLRVLMYVGARRGELCTIADIAEAYAISENHLMKVVHHLGQGGWLETVRGKGGGLRLTRAPSEIRVGDVVRATEESFAMVECFEDGSRCRIGAMCELRNALERARDAFLSELDRHTLADLLAPAPRLLRALRR